ncbi:uncharacterized protein VTP21DRAFT_11365 [Calcarisporiella thermophila]|uniref:uncharacterized protein n=1 Tax=Calcarisporiella thermophila TaxID=911321 RepID=UPI0037428E23
MYSVYICILLLLSIHLKYACAQEDARVALENGIFKGFKKHGLYQFLGVPYAAPPVKDLRFRPPQPPARSNRLNRATKFGPMCPQLLPIPYLMDEDCLTLNVWTPDMTPDNLYPVMVWVFGGTYEFGDSHMYNGEGFVRKTGNSVVLVSVNFRSNIFGYFATEAGIKEGAANIQLNDQQFALEWVQKNIHLFGGNPNDVTLFGESSGAGAIALHLLMYHNSTSRPFHKAIIMSAGPTTMIGDVRYYQSVLDKVVRRLGCTSSDSTKLIECMQKIPWPVLLSTYRLIRGPVELLISRVPTSPIVDGVLLPMKPEDMLKEGFISPIPILSGITTNEASLFMMVIYNPFRDWIQVLRGIIPGIQEQDIKKLSTYYPKNQYSSAYARAVELISDIVFKCPEHLLAKYAISTHYRYRFNQETVLLKLGPRPLHAAHALDLAYLWPDTLIFKPLTMVFTKRDWILSKEIINYWVCFAKTGNPNCEDQLEWPDYTTTRKRIVLQEPGLGLELDPVNIMDEKCDFINYLRSKY